MGDRAWQVPQEQFVIAWNGAKSLDEAAERVRELARGSVPRWAVMARAMELRKDGVAMKDLYRPAARAVGVSPASGSAART